MEIVTKTVTTLVIAKRPNVRNLENGTFSVSKTEAKLAQSVDEVTVRICDSFNKLLFEATFSSREFLNDLRPWKKADREGYFRSFVK